MDQIDLTCREAQVYLCAAVIFLGSILGAALAHGQTQVQLSGPAGLLLLLPVSAVVVIMSIARSIALRSSPRIHDLPFILAWGLVAIWLMWGLALPGAVHWLRRGR